MVSKFLKEVAYSFHPFRYRYLANQSFGQSIAFLSKILLLAIIIAGICAAPKIMSLKSDVESELGKFTEFRLSGNVSATGPVSVPLQDPFLVADLTDKNRSIGDETFLITKDEIKYRFLGLKSISIDDIKNPLNNKAAYSSFVTILFLMLLPSIAFLLFINLWIKYFLLVVIFAAVFFILLELTHFRLKFKQMLNVASHMLIIPVLLEVVSSAFNASYLIPLFKFLGTNVYLIPIIIFAALTLFAIIMIYIDNKIEGRSRKRKKK